MPLDNPQGGFGYAGEFQSAALPWVTSSIAPAAGSPVRYDFPFVTRFISITNLASSPNTLSIGFTYNGITKTNNKVIVPPGATLQFEWRVKSIWVQGENGTPAYNLAAGLTTILAKNMPQLSGTLDDGTLGWPGVG
jgi:hypothetical protein